MYSGYRFHFEELNKSAVFNDPEFFYIGAEQYQKDYEYIQRTLENDVMEDFVLDASSIQTNWFPHIGADIFLSHARKDENRAKIFAGFMKKHFNLNVCIDSCLWGYFNNLLKQVDDKFCSKVPGSYYREKCNYSASHIHMMLASSFMMMIDAIECLMYMDTPQALSIQEVTQTSNSPWIYMEMIMSHTMNRKRKELHESRISFFDKKSRGKNSKDKESVNIKYLLDMLQVKDMSFTDFQTFLQNKSDDKYSLDMLYEIIPINDDKYFYGVIN
jgi:hypothetical protein